MTNLTNIKKFLKKHKIDACLISKNNQFLNEITSQSENFLLKVTNFTGSLGYALIYQKNQQQFHLKADHKQVPLDRLHTSY